MWMPRSPRIEYEGAVYHVMARGNRREPIVFDDGDRELFVSTFAEACTKTGWEVFAWVLMDNHYHGCSEGQAPGLLGPGIAFDRLKKWLHFCATNENSHGSGFKK